MHLVVFWGCAAAFTVAALLLISVPRVRRARRRGLLVTLWIALPLLTVMLYGKFGAARDWVDYRQAETSVSEMPFQLAGFGSMEEVIGALRDAVNENPHDAQGWYLLGRSYLTEGEIDSAVEAFATAYQVDPMNVEIVAEYAQALMLVQTRDVGNQPLDLMQEVLVLDPEHESALTILAAYAFEQGEYAQAITHWQDLLVRYDADSDTGQLLQEAIQRAELLLSA